MSPKDFPQVQTTMANQQYCLKWNNHQVNLLRAFDRLLQSESFTDVTLACEGRSLRAHKVVLSACSSYFETLFEEHPDRSPIIILKDMKFVHVSQLVNFMYRGEINITQDMLSGLLRTAETLKIKGLAEVSGEQSNAAAAAAAAAVAAAHQFPSIAPNFRIAASLPQLITNHSSALTAALNAPVSNTSLAPLAALLNQDATLEERRASLLKRISQDDDSCSDEPLSKHARKEDVKCESPRAQSLSPLNNNNNGGVMLGHLGLRVGDSPQQHKPILPAPVSQKQNKSLPTNPTSPGQPVLTPIPSDLTVNAQQELPDFLQGCSVYRLNDYLGFRTRQQFWDEPAVRRIMEGIKNKEIDMKSAAEILGVSYGTLYGRYREVFGYLKHAWVNKPGRSPSSSSGQRERNIWDESRSQDLIQKVLNKELSLTAAAVRLGVDYNTFFAHLTSNGTNQARVSLLTGGSSSSSPLEDLTATTAMMKVERADEDEEDRGEDNNGPQSEYYDDEEEEEAAKYRKLVEEEEESSFKESEELEEEEHSAPMEDDASFPPPPPDDVDATPMDNEEEEEEADEAPSTEELNGVSKSPPVSENDQSEVPRLLEKVN